MIDLKTVIELYPECLNNADVFKRYMSDLYSDNKYMARIRILSDMIGCGIANEIKNGKTDNSSVASFCSIMENQYGYSSQLVNECVLLLVNTFIDLNTTCDIEEIQKDNIIEKDGISYICNPEDFKIDDKGNLIKYKGNDSCVAIPEGVTSIDREAFYWNKTINHVLLPNSLTYIGWKAFYGCSNLMNHDIPEGVVHINGYAYSQCNNLTEIVIPNSMQEISWKAFGDCINLKNITLLNSTTTIGLEAFINTAYYNDCNNWHDDVIYIGDYLIEARKSISGTYLIKDGTKVIANNAFSDCNRLKKVTLPQSITAIGGNAFANCINLNSINIPDSVTTTWWTSFENTGYANNPSNWKNDMLYIDNHLIRANEYISGTRMVKENTKTIAADTFYKCQRLIGISIPDSVIYIGVSAFSQCASLKTVYFKSEKQKNKFKNCFDPSVTLLINDKPYM